jgi:hypothetical protein
MIGGLPELSSHLALAAQSFGSAEFCGVAADRARRGKKRLDPPLCPEPDRDYAVIPSIPKSPESTGVASIASVIARPAAHRDAVNGIANVTTTKWRSP